LGFFIKIVYQISTDMLSALILSHVQCGVKRNPDLAQRNAKHLTAPTKGRQFRSTETRAESALKIITEKAQGLRAIAISAVLFAEHPDIQFRSAPVSLDIIVIDLA
jgi:hypothetical protein